MVESNRFAICFFSVVSFQLTLMLPRQEVYFSLFIFLIAFQTVLGLVFDVSKEQKLWHVFF